MHPGGTWSGDYVVCSYENMLEYIRGDKHELTTHHIPEILVPALVEFPLLEARKVLQTARTADALRDARRPFVDVAPPVDAQAVADAAGVPLDLVVLPETFVPPHVLYGGGSHVDGTPIRYKNDSKRPRDVPAEAWCLFTPKEKREYIASLNTAPAAASLGSIVHLPSTFAS